MSTVTAGLRSDLHHHRSMAGRSERRARRRVFLSAGFRPFFLLTGVYAALAVLLWLALLDGAVLPAAALPPMVWHAHEMVYGVVAGALAGFLLTAMANWTGTAPLAGGGLAGLVALWLAGRLVVWLPPSVPYGLVAGVDAAFLPILALYAARVMAAAGHRRNMLLVAVILAMAAGNGLLHLAMGGAIDPAWARAGLVLGVDATALLLAVIGARIVPTFTRNALAARGEPADIAVSPWLKALAPASVALLAAVDLAAPMSTAAGAVALAAAALNAVRLARWKGARTLGDPLLWVLHLGFLWLVVGLALKGLAPFVAAVPEGAGLHAIGVGAAGTMILAVMSRAALGHTGRPLVAPPALAFAYAAVGVAALLRVAAALAPAFASLALLHVAAGLWVLAFAAFTAVMAPVLLGPRVDGAGAG